MWNDGAAGYYVVDHDAAGLARALAQGARLSEDELAATLIEMVILVDAGQLLIGDALRATAPLLREARADARLAIATLDGYLAVADYPAARQRLRERHGAYARRLPLVGPPGEPTMQAYLRWMIVRLVGGFGVIATSRARRCA